MATSPDTDTVSDSGVPKEEDSNNGTEQKLISIIKYPITTSATCITDADVSDSIVTFVSPDESGTHLDALSLSSQKALVSFSDKKNTNKNSTLRARSDFYKRDQREGESISEYVSDLRRLAAECNFKGNSDESLRDRFIMGLREDDMRDTILSITNCEVTFEVAFAIAMDMEPKDNLEKESVVNKDLDDGTTSILKTEKGDEGGTFEQDVEVKVEPHEVSSIQTPGEVHPQKVYSFSKSGNSVIITVTDAHFGTTSSHEVSTVDSGSANNGGIIDDGADDNNDAFGDTECEEPSENAEYIPSVVNRTPSSVNSSGYSLRQSGAGTDAQEVRLYMETVEHSIGNEIVHNVYNKWTEESSTDIMTSNVKLEGMDTESVGFSSKGDELVRKLYEKFENEATASQSIVKPTTNSRNKIIRKAGAIKRRMRGSRMKKRCPRCGLYIVDMKKHMMFYHSGGDRKTKCTLCGLPVRDMDKHLASFHSQENKCPICNKVYSTPRYLRGHMKLHTKTKLSICSYCGKAFVHPSALKAHERTHTGEKPKECKICHKRFALQDRLTLHMRRHSGDKRYLCDYCGKLFVSSSKLGEHVKSHTGNDPHKCTQCEKAFPYAWALKKHMISHSDEKPFLCTECGRQFATKNSLNAHTKRHKEGATFKKRRQPMVWNKYECDICHAKFRHESRFTEHQWVHTGKKKHVCNICDKTFVEARSLKFHMDMHKGEKPFQCKHCDKSYSVPTSLRYHMRSHSDQRPDAYVCNQCGKSFVDKPGLNKHILKIHCRSQKCPHCQKEFKDKSEFTRHVLSHDGVKPFECTECSKNFVLKEDLTNHMKYHEEKKFLCTYCDKRFYAKHRLLAHTRFHTNERPFKCSYCDKAFCDQAARTVHEKIHTGRKKRKCPDCDKEYFTITGLKLHSKVHQKQKESPTEQVPQVSHVFPIQFQQVSSFGQLETQYIQLELPVE